MPPEDDFAQEDFAAIVRLVQTDYAGYGDKISGREAELEAHTSAIHGRLERAADSAERTETMLDWMRFFRDRHMGLGSTARAATDAVKLGGPDMAPRFERIDRESALIRIPSFGTDRKTEIDTVIEEHRDELASNRFLVVDIRGNTGGSDYSAFAIHPLLYTDPVTVYGADVLASDGNTAYYRGLLDGVEAPEELGPYRAPWPDELKAYLREIVARMEANPGELVPYVDDQRFTCDAVLDRPERVGILIDGRCVSAAEQFLLIARESRKTTLFGANTGGCLDYSNLRPVLLPSRQRILRIPTTRSRMLPGFSVDAHGIPPDVRIPDSASDPIAFVLNALRRET